MKRMIVLVWAIWLSVSYLAAQQTTSKPVYYINGQRVENFDGSQLVGKTISYYKIENERNLHVILTADFTKGKEATDVIVLSDDKGNGTDSQPSARADKEEHIYVIDGQVVTGDKVKELPPSQIASIEVIKDKTHPDFVKYAREAQQSLHVRAKYILLITTKKEKK